MDKRQKRVVERRNKIIQFLEKEQAFDIKNGKTIKEIASGIDESESTVRVDLEALKSEGVRKDSSRVPNVFWLERSGK
jgi:DeoR/GlpR family transcriptional regulator of sugar metabolism